MSGNVSTGSDEFDEVIDSRSAEVFGSRCDEFDDDDDDVSDDDKSDVTRMGRRTVSQARWVTERRVAGTMQSSLPTAHLRSEGLLLF